MEHTVQILDTTLRDGSYAIDFQFTPEDTALIASALESAGIRLIEIGHGVGLGGARAGKGDQPAPDAAYLKAAAGVLRKARFGTFFIPGIAAEDDLRMARDCGMGFVRIGTNVTELEQGAPFIALAKKLGFRVWSNLMKSYALPPKAWAEKAREAASCGADVVCLVDSAGGMLPEDVRSYLHEGRSRCTAALGFHGHDNLCMAVANTLEALSAGASVLDASLQGMGRSEGNAVTEVLAAILQKRGLLPGLDVNGLLDISEAFIRPLLREARHTPIGITAGRAKFHSSFLARIMKAATGFGIDPRDLILRLGEHDQVEAPAALIEELAAQIAADEPRQGVRVDIAATTAETPACFDEQVRARILELREKACKSGYPSVLNVVVTPYEMTRVSPFCDTNYGCAMTNIMLAEADLLENVLRAADGLIDYVLLDAGGHEVPENALTRTRLLRYLDHEMWARATVSHVAILLGGTVDGRKVALTGVPPLAVRAALSFAEAGALVRLDAELEKDAYKLDARTGPGRIAFARLDEAVADVDALVSLSPRRPCVGPDLVARMASGALLYDGGIGSLEPDATPAAEVRGVRVVRVDMRPSLAASALELIGMRKLVEQHMGREAWDGVSVVAGGLIGRKGDVIVDSVRHPTRVIGIADGKGGILGAPSNDPGVQRVRRAIAQKRLKGA